MADQPRRVGSCVSRLLPRSRTHADSSSFALSLAGNSDTPELMASPGPTGPTTRPRRASPTRLSTGSSGTTRFVRRALPSPDGAPLTPSLLRLCLAAHPSPVLGRGRRIRRSFRSRRLAYLHRRRAASPQNPRQGRLQPVRVRSGVGLVVLAVGESRPFRVCVPCDAMRLTSRVRTIAVPFFFPSHVFRGLKEIGSFL